MSVDPSKKQDLILGVPHDAALTVLMHLLPVKDRDALNGFSLDKRKFDLKPLAEGLARILKSGPAAAQWNKVIKPWMVTEISSQIRHITFDFLTLKWGTFEGLGRSTAQAKLAFRKSLAHFKLYPELKNWLSHDSLLVLFFASWDPAYDHDIQSLPLKLINAARDEKNFGTFEQNLLCAWFDFLIGEFKEIVPYYPEFKKDTETLKEIQEIALTPWDEVFLHAFIYSIKKGSMEGLSIRSERDSSLWFSKARSKLAQARKELSHRQVRMPQDEYFTNLTKFLDLAQAQIARNMIGWEKSPSIIKDMIEIIKTEVAITQYLIPWAKRNGITSPRNVNPETAKLLIEPSPSIPKLSIDKNFFRSSLGDHIALYYYWFEQMTQYDPGLSPEAKSSKQDEIYSGLIDAAHFSFSAAQTHFKGNFDSTQDVLGRFKQSHVSVKQLRGTYSEDILLRVSSTHLSKPDYLKWPRMNLQNYNADHWNKGYKFVKRNLWK